MSCALMLVASDLMAEKVLIAELSSATVSALRRMVSDGVAPWQFEQNVTYFA